MGKGYKHGTGGGASSLNYKVVGGTSAPASPRENMFWVNTSNDITDHVFSAEEPAMAEGRVWFQTGTVSVVKFNALKKNNVTVYPVSAKQCVSNAWVNMAFKAYIGGAWKEPYFYLFADGDQYEAVTGGWTNVASGSDTLTVHYSAEQEYGAEVTSSTVDAMDITAYKQLTVKVASYTETFTVSVKDASGSVVATASAAAVGNVVVDVSSLSGEYYVELKATAADHGGWATAYFTVIEAHLT